MFIACWLLETALSFRLFSFFYLTNYLADICLFVLAAAEFCKRFLNSKLIYQPLLFNVYILCFCCLVSDV